MEKKCGIVPIATFIFILSCSNFYAQTPTGVPQGGDYSPLDLMNPADVIIYIVLPIVFIILYFIWKRKKRE
ncbi:MAG: adenylosuccinate synthetase [Flavobacteriaceae bacterium]|nr:adenylosuccinate synthetase [Flavobacteriaceae bacterium]